MVWDALWIVSRRVSPRGKWLRNVESKASLGYKTKSHSKNKSRSKLSLGNFRFCLKNIITWRAASKKATPSLHLPEVELWKRINLFNYSQFALDWILTTSTIIIKKVHLPALQSFSPSKASSRQVSLSPSAIALAKGIWIYLLLIMALQIVLKIGI